MALAKQNTWVRRYSKGLTSFVSELAPFNVHCLFPVVVICCITNNGVGSAHLFEVFIQKDGFSLYS